MFLIELVPAFEGHPEFPRTFYAGDNDNPSSDNPLRYHQTQSKHSAVSYDCYFDAAEKIRTMLPTKSCVWKIVEEKL